MLETTKITDKIILVSAPTQYELSSTFLRFQEHYESSEWKGKVFTEGQFRSWYSEKYGANTYERDWGGFNIPSYILSPFIQGLFDPLSEAEKELIALFRYRTDCYYIIGAQPDKADTLDHEVCHGLYCTNAKYQAAAGALVAKYRRDCEDLYAWLDEHMYHPDVHDDEVHAYASADYEWLKEQNVNIPEELHKSLRKLKDKYYKE